MGYSFSSYCTSSHASNAHKAISWLMRLTTIRPPKSCELNAVQVMTAFVLTYQTRKKIAQPLKYQTLGLIHSVGL